MIKYEIIIIRKNWEFQYYNEKSDIKPGFLKVKPSAAIRSQSPLVSVLAPPIKFRMAEFEYIFILISVLKNSLENPGN